MHDKNHLHTREELIQNNITDVTTMYTRDRGVRVITIPKEFVFMERVKTNNALSSGDIIIDVCMNLMGYTNLDAWETKNGEGNHRSGDKRANDAWVDEFNYYYSYPVFVK